MDHHFLSLFRDLMFFTMSPPRHENTELVLGWASLASCRPSSLGRRTVNFTAIPDESRGKFAGANNLPTLRNIKSKILPLSRNKLVIWAVKKVCFLHVSFFHAIHPRLLITLHSTERRKHKNNKNNSPCRADHLRYL